MLAGIAYALAATAVAVAGDSAEVFAGGQVDFSNYVYLGATVPLGSHDGNGFAIQGLVDAGNYDYDDGTLKTVKATFGGGELDVLYRISRKKFWSDFGAGVDDTYTGLTPYDPTNPLRGEQVETRISTDGGTIAGAWRADWEGYYGVRLADYEALVGVTHSLSPIWRLGAEIYSEGNPTYSLYETGPYAGLTFGKESELQFSAGAAWESGFPSRPYLRATIYERL